MNTYNLTSKNKEVAKFAKQIASENEQVQASSTRKTPAIKSDFLLYEKNSVCWLAKFTKFSALVCEYFVILGKKNIRKKSISNTKSY